MQTLFKDDAGNQSSMRVVFVVFMITTIMLLVIIAALVIRSYLEGNGTDDFNKLIQWLTTGGLGGFLAKVFQKRYEKKEPAPTPTTPLEGSPRDLGGAGGRSETKPPRIVVQRHRLGPDVTPASCGIWNGLQYTFTFQSIELPWRENQRGISCIPAGTYKAIATRRASNGRYAIWLLDVIGRSEIMIHTANYVRELRGCIAPGRAHTDLDGDGTLDVTHSATTMAELEKHFPLGSELIVEIRNP